MRDFQFDEAKLKQLGWMLLKPGDALTPADLQYAWVIGMAVWDKPGLRALDLFTKKQDPRLKVYLFNVDEFNPATDMEAFLPGCPWPAATPILACYFRGELGGFFVGPAALTQISANRLG